MLQKAKILKYTKKKEQKKGEKGKKKEDSSGATKVTRNIKLRK